MPSSSNVLIVEDEYLIALDLWEEREQKGYHCHIEGTVDGALSYLGHETPRFAVLDHLLWQSPSTKVAERLAEMSVPFCVCSASFGDELTGFFAARPMLTKPYSLKNLESVLTALLAIT